MLLQHPIRPFHDSLSQRQAAFKRMKLLREWPKPLKRPKSCEAVGKQTPPVIKVHQKLRSGVRKLESGWRSDKAHSGPGVSHVTGAFLWILLMTGCPLRLMIHVTQPGELLRGRSPAHPRPLTGVDSHRPN
ncbi:hypothetical protein J6590_029180 [Homalodisca vitripennis]|nr:hypothetical protein J6590_029180 [Homalodisca vitripennis]